MYQLLSAIIDQTHAPIIQFRFQNASEKTKAYETAPSNYHIDYFPITDEGRRTLLLNDSGFSLGGLSKVYSLDLIRSAGVRFAEGVSGYEEPLFTFPLKLSADAFAYLDAEIYYYRYNPNSSIHSALNHPEKLWEHALVQEQVWNFVKNTEAFGHYYPEIEMYFLHSYFYETLYFGKKRGFPLTAELFHALCDGVKSKGLDYNGNSYLNDPSLQEDAQYLSLIDSSASMDDIQLEAALARL